jgi:TRAP-type mannitol/chloroaromatic compound transport system substrate-binding protein
MSERRRFIVKTGGALVAAGVVTVAGGPYVIAQPKIQWRMSTAFSAAFDVHLRAAQQMAKVVEEASSGRFQIAVFPGGQIMQPFDCFDAAVQGKIEAFMANSYYWTDRKYRQHGPEEEPAVEWFSTVPFGMNTKGMSAWFH